jgi:hypothetical protein
VKKIWLSVLLVTLGLAACGGGEDETEAVVETIEASATSKAPQDCKALATQAYQEQAQMLEGFAAVTNCEYDAKEPGNDPESVEVREVEIEGPRATAEVTYLGGAFNGQTLAVGLIEKGGRWKLNEIVRFTQFDRPKLIAAFQKWTLEYGLGSFSRSLSSCIGKRLDKRSRPDLEEVILGGSPLPIELAGQSCGW